MSAREKTRWSKGESVGAGEERRVRGKERRAEKRNAGEEGRLEERTMERRNERKRERQSERGDAMRGGGVWVTGA